MADTTAIEYATRLADFLNRHAEVLPFDREVAEVQVLAGRERKSARKRNSNASQPSDKGDALFIVLRPRSAPSRRPAPPPPGAELDTPIQDTLAALYDAERTPGHSFVALKWFRDTYLLRCGFPWAQSPDTRDRVLRELTRLGWVRVDKIPNPRNPGFDTSALRLQLTLPEVQARLNRPAPTLGWDFTPIAIPGELMSETVRRMRDERD